MMHRIDRFMDTYPGFSLVMGYLLMGVGLVMIVYAIHVASDRSSKAELDALLEIYNECAATRHICESDLE